MQTIGELWDRAEGHLLRGEYLHALGGFRAVVEQQPLHLEARLRIADSLLALGEVQRSAEVYTALARIAANAGHPLLALVSLKILTTLEPLLAELITQLADLYGEGSARVGQGARLRAGDPAASLTPGFVTPSPTEADRDVLVASAAGLGARPPSLAFPERVPPIPLFSDLPADAFARVVGAAKLRRVRPGEVVIAEGDPGTSFFMLARGEVRVDKALAEGPTRLAALGQGAIFGEIALVSASPRTASVIAERATDLLELDRDALVAAADEMGSIASALDRFSRQRLLSNLLATAPLFEPLTPTQRRDLARRFLARQVDAGTSLLREGEPGVGLFVVLSGQVDVSKVDRGQRVLLATLGAGEVFGEISLVQEQPVTATVTAAVRTTVLLLPKEVFQKLAAAVPAIGEYVREVGDERLMDTRILLDR